MNTVGPGHYESAQFLNSPIKKDTTTKAARFPKLSVSPGPAEYLIKEFSPAEQYTFNKATYN